MTAQTRSDRRTFLNLGLLLVAILMVVGMVATPARADTLIDTFIVKFRDGIVTEGTMTLPGAQVQTIGTALQSGFVESGRTKDSAVRISLIPALSIDEARSALNRIRMDGSVLYASFGQSEEAMAQIKASPQAPPPGPPTSRLIVKYRDQDRSAAAIAGVPLEGAQLDRLSALAGRPLAFLRSMHDGAQVLLMFQALPVAVVEGIAAAIALQPDIDFAQPDYIDQIQLVPSDPCYASASLAACNSGFQWDLFNPVSGINAPAAWNITTGSASIRAAVIDTGALFSHPDLSGRFIAGYDMITTGLGVVTPNDGDSRDPDASDVGDWTTTSQCSSGSTARTSTFHGSHVAGTIGATPNNSAGIAGINWVSSILPVRVLGSCGGWSSDIADAIVWASGGTVVGVPANSTPARVLNLSIGGSRSYGSCDSVYQTAISGALGRSSVVVVSAGNSNIDAGYSAPANCPGVVTVAATGQTGLKAYYSNYNAPGLGNYVDIAAPGGDSSIGRGILSTINNGATTPSPSGYIYAEFQGTSMAAPHVTGVVSLMLSVNAALTPSQVIAKLQSAARAFPASGSACATTTGTSPPVNAACNCTTALCGAGLLDAYRAVALSQVGGVATTAAVTSTLNPSTVGASITFNATVVGIVPTGSVAFKDGGVNITGCSVVALTGTGDTKNASCTTTALPAGSRSITVVYGGDSNNGMSTSSVLTQTVSTTAGSAKKRVNFDANLTDDLAWRSQTGQTAVWLMNGLAYSSYAIVLGDPNWTVTHTGDLNGDSRTDLIWRHTSGMTVAWLMDGTGYTSYATLATDANLLVLRLADFDGDGKADILWRNTVTGQTSIMLMNGLVPTGSAILSGDPNWLVTNVGDFNGDGKADLVWRNASTGQAAIWLMGGLTPISVSVILTDANWAVTHVADVSGDGKSDLVWRNSSTGETVIWVMSGVVPTSGGVILTDTSWAVTHVGDFNGDGRDDLLWLNNGAGQTAIWLMNGLAPTTSVVVLTDANWRVTHIADLNGDGKSDLVWRNSASGATTGWLMNGAAYSSFATLLADPSWTVTPQNGL